jgi:hypothetical protein
LIRRGFSPRIKPQARTVAVSPRGIVSRPLVGVATWIAAERRRVRQTIEAAGKIERQPWKIGIDGGQHASACHCEHW